MPWSMAVPGSTIATRNAFIASRNREDDMGHLRSTRLAVAAALWLGAAPTGARRLAGAGGGRERHGGDGPASRHRRRARGAGGRRQRRRCGGRGRLCARGHLSDGGQPRRRRVHDHPARRRDDDLPRLPRAGAGGGDQGHVPRRQGRAGAGGEHRHLSRHRRARLGRGLRGGAGEVRHEEPGGADRAGARARAGRLRARAGRRRLLPPTATTCWRRTRRRRRSS